jgi:hypothetical protein
MSGRTNGNPRYGLEHKTLQIVIRPFLPNPDKPNCARLLN